MNDFRSVRVLSNSALNSVRVDDRPSADASLALTRPARWLACQPHGLIAIY